jgi:hypothetical protein
MKENGDYRYPTAHTLLDDGGAGIQAFHSGDM